MSTPLLDADALALRWGVSTDQVYRLARQGRLPTVKLGRYVRFSPLAIAAFEAAGGAA